MTTSNYKIRADVRPKEKFNRDIKIGHQNESIAMDLFFWKFWKLKSPSSELYHTGCDNTGEIIEGQVYDTPDFTIVVDNVLEIPIGVSASWHPDFSTIKKYNLLKRSQNEHEYMLVAFNVGYNKKVSMVFGKTKRFLELTKTNSCCVYLDNFADSGKPGYRFFNVDLNEIAVPVAETAQMKISFLD